MVDEVHILWTSEGMSCDGDSVSITAAMQPSLEEVVLGLIPGLPRVRLHNKVLAYSLGGDEFMQAFHQAANGQLGAPFVFVVEGSIPNEQINGDGYWTSMGNDPATGQPITLNTWIDRLAPKAWAVVAIGTCAAYGGIHAMAGNPTGSMGLCDYLGWDFRSSAGIPIVNVPGCPVQPDNFMETLTWLLYQAAGLSPMIPLDDMHRPTWSFGKTVHEGCDVLRVCPEHGIRDQDAASGGVDLQPRRSGRVHVRPLSSAEQERLVDVFGEPPRRGQTLRSLL
jgi:hydrogenase small subunit